MTKRGWVILGICAGSVIFLTIGIPLMIDISYSLPFVWFFVEWSAKDLLNYYTSVLEICATVLSILVSVVLAVSQIIHQQQYHDSMRKWTETEQRMDEAIRVINPAELQYLRTPHIGTEKWDSVKDTVILMMEYCKNLNVVIDQIVGTLYGLDDVELNKLVSMIIEIRNSLVQIAHEDARNCTTLIGRIQEIKDLSEQLAARKFFGIPFKQNEGKQKIAEKQQKAYAEYHQGVLRKKELLLAQQNNFQLLLANKSKFFCKKHQEIARTKPKFFWMKSID
jgi:hypothetical protein